MMRGKRKVQRHPRPQQQKLLRKMQSWRQPSLPKQRPSEAKSLRKILMAQARHNSQKRKLR